MNDEPSIESEIVAHLGQIKRIAIRVVKNEAAAEDAAQDAVIRMLESKNKLTDIRNLKGWINIVARNECITFSRRRIRRLQHEKQINYENVPDTPPPEKFITEDLITILLSSIDVLTERQKCVIYQRYFEKKKVIDIAAENGVSQSSVSVRIKKGLRRLSAEMKRRFNSLPPHIDHPLQPK